RFPVFRNPPSPPQQLAKPMAPCCLRLRDLLSALRLLLKRRCQVELLDAVVLGRDKWLGGELGCDGCVYGIPGSASRVLKVDGSRVELIGPELAGKFKWLRGIELKGIIYG
ncbi:unnamed protein product, partial [Effrenium voratum]